LNEKEDVDFIVVALDRNEQWNIQFSSYIKGRNFFADRAITNIPRSTVYHEVG
jgi:hypothetical protein